MALGFLKRNGDGKKEMSFLDHLEDLRAHLIRMLVAVAVCASLAFIYKEIVFDDIIFAPKRADFFTYRAFCWLASRVHLDLCIREIPFTLINTQLSGQFMLHMWVALVAGLVASFPYILWEIWRFIKPALKEREQKYTTGVVFFGSLLFMLGVLFGYFLIAPMSINFLGAYQVSAEVKNFISLDSYISTITILTLATGTVFELPLLVYFFSKINLLSPGFMRQYRKHALVVILIVAALITPTPDVTGQVLVAIPLYILYEVSIYVSAMVERGRRSEF